MSTTHQQFASIADAGARLFTQSHLAHSHQHITHQVRRQRVARASATTVASIGLVGAGAFGLVSLAQPSTTVVGPAASGSADPDAFPSGVPTAETSTSPDTATEAIAEGTVDITAESHPKDVAAQIAKLYGVSADHALAAITSALPPEADGNAEGWLGEGTYDVEPSVSLERMAQLVTAQMPESLSAAGIPRDEWQATVIAASIVQAEVPEGTEQSGYQAVADVIANRLAADMSLQVDSPLMYALGSDSLYPTVEELETDTPYNTYGKPGLPPTAIGMVSPTSLDAVIQAPQSDVKYYVVTGPTVIESAVTWDEFMELLERVYIPDSN